jgi:probable HAF family extracellular repeat protein
MSKHRLMLIAGIAVATAIVPTAASGASAARATAQSQHNPGPHYALTVLGTLGGSGSGANGGINNRGQVAGFSALRGNRKIHAFVWAHGVMTDHPRRAE